MASAQTAPDATGALELRGLGRSFGEIVAVDGLSFSVPAGCVFAFVGRDGAGMTTMRIVCAGRAACSWLERLGLGGGERVRAQELSHGNQQRVQLAAALVDSPDLVILGEPLAGLDPIATDVMVTATDLTGVRPQATAISNIQAVSVAL